MLCKCKSNSGYSLNRIKMLQEEFDKMSDVDLLEGETSGNTGDVESVYPNAEVRV